MDAATTVLNEIRFTGWFFCDSHLRAPWGIALPGGRVAAVHAVLDGECRIDVEGLAAGQRLAHGDIAFLPFDTPHQLRSGAEVTALPVAELPLDRSDRQLVRLEHGGSGTSTRMLTASFTTAEFLPYMALTGMPPLIVIASASHPKLGLILELCRAEHHEQGFARSALLRRLGEVLFIATLQAVIERVSTSTGWLAALNDPQLGRALALMHARPGEPWSLASLGEAAGMSRSSFCEHFRRRVGMTPLNYLGRLRIDRAAELIGAGRPIGRVARDCGYASIASFTRAFTRATGMTPGRYRAAQQQEVRPD